MTTFSQARHTEREKQSATDAQQYGASPRLAAAVEHLVTEIHAASALVQELRGILSQVVDQTRTSLNAIVQFSSTLQKQQDTLTALDVSTVLLVGNLRISAVASLKSSPR